MYAWGWRPVWEQARCLQHQGEIKKRINSIHVYVVREREREREREKREEGREGGRDKAQRERGRDT